jgi:DNA repair protein RadC
VNLIHEIPLDERPRERLQKKGADALSNEELLAVILGTGSKEKPVLELSRSLLSHFESPQSLFHASLGELAAFPGIGQAKASLLKAAFALAERALEQVEDAKPVIKLPEQAFKAVLPMIRGEKRELFLILLLDSKSRLLRTETVSIGILNATLVHPREVFFPVIKHSAYAIIAVHNHPSGDLSPSKEDVNMTKQLLAASKSLGIPLFDHLIVSETNYFSLKTSLPDLFQ